MLAPPQRSKAGYRLYPPDAVADLRFIARAKALGLSLEQIRVLRTQSGAQAQRRQLRHLLGCPRLRGLPRGPWQTIPVMGRAPPCAP
ncbi:MAG: MerR family transcriptional regulator [Gemmatimonadales bacterium]